MTEILFNIQKPCCLCLKNVEIGKDLLVNKPLCVIVETIFNIQVNNHQNYPTSICDGCEHEILLFNVYYTQVIANQNILKKRYLKEFLELDARQSEVKVEWECDRLPDSVDSFDDAEPSCALHEDETIRNFYSLKCCQCENDTFETFELLQDHCRSIHKNEPHLICCDTKIYTKNLLLDHITHHNKILDTEKVDGKPDTKNVLTPPEKRLKKGRPNHDQKIREFFRLKCNLCVDYELFTSFKQLQDHYSEKHKSRGYVECCDKKYFRKEHLIDHITNHINPNAHKCLECGKMCKTKNSLKVHMKRHMPVEERPYQCCICPSRYATKTLLTKHELSHLSEADKKFTCDQCGKAFAIKSVLVKHKLIHSTEHKFVCESCGRLFNSKGNLQLHMNNMHNNDPRPKLQCHICQSWFKNNDTLRKHIRHHTEQNDYKCDQCDKVFSSKNLLWCHVRYVHTQIRKYSCSICERTFRRKLELTEHMARHAGKTLYECEKCTKSFMYSSHFSQHRKNCQVVVST